MLVSPTAAVPADPVAFRPRLRSAGRDDATPGACLERTLRRQASALRIRAERSCLGGHDEGRARHRGSRRWAGRGRMKRGGHREGRRRTGIVRAWRSLRRIILQAYHQFERDNAFVVAGYIAYMGMFAIFPFLIFLLALAGFFGQWQAAATSVDLGLQLLPPDVAKALQPAIGEVRDTPHAGLITFSILVTLWVSSSGLEALRHALNNAYNVDDRPSFLRSRLESLALTIVAALIIILAAILLFIVPLSMDIVSWVLKETVRLQVSIQVARYLTGIGLLLGLVMTLYKVLPNLHLRSMEVVPGAVLAWLGWVVLQYAYTVYLRVIPGYSVTYGSLGGIMATLFFFYMSALLFIFGAELNSVLRRRRENREVISRP